MPKKEKKVRVTCVKRHGACYAFVSGELLYYPMMRGERSPGKVELTYLGTVEESPKNFRKGHIRALKRLGATESQVKRATRRVAYY